MSIPENPLNASGSTSFRHVLVAFKYAEDAFEVNEFNPQGVTVGDSLDGVGPNIVVINEFTDQRFSIPEAVWDFDFTPCIGVTTSTSVGKLVVADRFVPYNFVGYLEREVLAYLNKDAIGSKNLMSLSHATFMLKTIFTLEQTEGDSLEGDTRSPSTVRVNPFFFNIDSIESVPTAGSITPHTHILHVMGASNTTGLLRSFSSVFQMNITHKAGNIHTEIPRGTGTGGRLRFRDQEDQTNNRKRKDRLDLSKPMITLQHIFEGLQADLNQLKYPHQGQLQKWLEEINPSHRHKITASVKQLKEPSPEQLPMSYKIDLDPLYNHYQIDNRNMPFEQPNVSQGENGIRVFPVRPGIHILDLISNIMLLSKQVGIDAINSIPKTFKVSVTAIRKRTNEIGYEINIKIRRYDIPRNSIIHGKATPDNVVDTGPGEAGDNALHFFINDPLEADVDVVAFKSHINYDSGDNMLEQQVEASGTNIVYGDREQATAERDLTVPFFQTIYSGVRPMIGSYVIDGLENAQRAGDVINLMGRHTYTQTTDYELVILGNPFLLSDVNRNPKDVVSDVDGVVHYYPKPEVNPMYIRLTIFEKSQVDMIGGAGEENEDIPDRFYYDGHYHVARVINKFGIIGGGRSFYQNLILKRGDTLV